MTPEDWQRCDDLRTMIRLLRGRVSGRKLRLFGCACARLFWDRLNREGSRRAVEVAERYADGLATPGELTAAGSAAAKVRTRWCRIADVARASAYADDFESALLTSVFAVRGEARDDLLAGLVRCVFGNPLRPSPAVRPEVLAYKGGAAHRLAEAIYAARRFEDLPVLADLLEEAGCADALLLAHFRGPGPHCLGCHALDAVLGKS
jgi:hypothetical protein